MATDTNSPAQSIRFHLAGEPPLGATIDLDTGLFRWTPSEAQGPGAYTLTAVATDNGIPNLETPVTFTVHVLEVNQPPSLDAVPDQQVVLGAALTLTLSATDPDLPAQPLAFALGPGTPAGAQIDPATGLFQWTPALDPGPGQYTVLVQVTDADSPPRTDQRSFVVTVVLPPQPPLQLPPPTLEPTRVAIPIPTVAGRTYRLEYTDALGTAPWKALPAVTGNGTVLTLEDPAPHPSARFYRIAVAD